MKKSLVLLLSSVFMLTCIPNLNVLADSYSESQVATKTAAATNNVSVEKTGVYSGNYGNSINLFADFAGRGCYVYTGGSTDGFINGSRDSYGDTPTSSWTFDNSGWNNASRAQTNFENDVSGRSLSYYTPDKVKLIGNHAYLQLWVRYNFDYYRGRAKTLYSKDSITNNHTPFDSSTIAVSNSDVVNLSQAWDTEILQINSSASYGGMYGTGVTASQDLSNIYNPGLPGYSFYQKREVYDIQFANGTADSVAVVQPIENVTYKSKTDAYVYDSLVDSSMSLVSNNPTDNSKPTTTEQNGKSDINFAINLKDGYIDTQNSDGPYKFPNESATPTQVSVSGLNDNQIKYNLSSAYTYVKIYKEGDPSTVVYDSSGQTQSIGTFPNFNYNLQGVRFPSSGKYIAELHVKYNKNITYLSDKYNKTYTYYVGEGTLDKSKELSKSEVETWVNDLKSKGYSINTGSIPYQTDSYDNRIYSQITVGGSYQKTFPITVLGVPRLSYNVIPHSTDYNAPDSSTYNPINLEMTVDPKNPTTKFEGGKAAITLKINTSPKPNLNLPAAVVNSGTTTIQSMPPGAVVQYGNLGIKINVVKNSSNNYVVTTSNLPSDANVYYVWQNVLDKTVGTNSMTKVSPGGQKEYSFNLTKPASSNYLFVVVKSNIIGSTSDTSSAYYGPFNSYMLTSSSTIYTVEDGSRIIPDGDVLCWASSSAIRALDVHKEDYSVFNYTGNILIDNYSKYTFDKLTGAVATSPQDGSNTMQLTIKNLQFDKDKTGEYSVEASSFYAKELFYLTNVTTYSFDYFVGVDNVDTGNKKTLGEVNSWLNNLLAQGYDTSSVHIPSPVPDKRVYALETIPGSVFREMKKFTVYGISSSADSTSR